MRTFDAVCFVRAGIGTTWRALVGWEWPDCVSRDSGHACVSQVYHTVRYTEGFGTVCYRWEEWLQLSRNNNWELSSNGFFVGYIIIFLLVGTRNEQARKAVGFGSCCDPTRPDLGPRRTLCWNECNLVCTDLRSSWTGRFTGWFWKDLAGRQRKQPTTDSTFSRKSSYLVDPASSDMLVSKIKPCKSKYKQLYGETADGSLKQFEFIWWITTRNGYP